MSGRRGRGPLWFCVKFIVFVPALTALWWLLLPWYGQVLLQVTGGVLKFAMGVPIEAGRIVAKDVLNTGTDLAFRVGDRERSLHIALLVTNVPPYAALVLATAGLAFWKRLRILLYGCGILCLGHAAFIVIVFRYQEAFMKASEIPTAVVQFFLTLPFLLWIVFAYWDKLTGPGNGKAPAPPAPPSGEPQ